MAEYNLGDIEIRLDDPKSINDAITKVNLIKYGLNTAMKSLQEYLLDQGVIIARQRLVRMSTEDVTDGDLYSSIERSNFVYNESTGKGVAFIMAGYNLKTGKNGMSYAVYVEFGTGIYKKSEETEAKKSSPTSIWGPKLNLPAKRDQQPETATGKKWVYFNEKDGNWYTTSGQPPKHFMADTLYELWSKGNDFAAKLIADHLPHEVG